MYSHDELVFFFGMVRCRSVLFFLGARRVRCSSPRSIVDSLFVARLLNNFGAWYVRRSF